MCCRKRSPRQSPRLRSRLEKDNKEQMVLVCMQQKTPLRDNFDMLYNKPSC